MTTEVAEPDDPKPPALTTMTVSPSPAEVSVLTDTDDDPLRSWDHSIDALPWERFYGELLRRNHASLRGQLGTFRANGSMQLRVEDLDETIHSFVNARLDAKHNLAKPVKDKVDEMIDWIMDATVGESGDPVDVVKDIAIGSVLKVAVDTPSSMTYEAIDRILTEILKAKTTLNDAVGAAVRTSPSVVVTLVVYLYVRYLQIWEETSNWRGIRRAIAATRNAIEASKPTLLVRDPFAATVVGWVMGLISAVEQAMEVESGLNCSCPVTMQDAASKVADQAASILGDASGRSSGNPDRLLKQAKRILRDCGTEWKGGCREFVQSRAAIDLLYFRSISFVSEAVGDYIDGGPDVFRKLSEVIDEVASNEKFLRGDVYASELRSHRIGLESLREARDRLHVDLANVIYCYPFAAGTDPAALVEAANRCKEDDKNTWAFEGNEASFEDFELTDMWDGPAAQRFTGISVSFAHDVRVRTPAEEILNFSDDLTFSLEIRISSLGNHYLRMQSLLSNASVHDLNQAMRRATRQMGEEKVAFGSADHGPYRAEWPRLADLAEELVEWVVRVLDPNATVPPRKGQPHIIVTAQELSLERVGVRGDDRFRRDISVGELSEASGAALLVQPVRQAAGVLEEWSRYGAPKFDDKATIRHLSFAGDFAHRTTNTTCALLRGTPEYLLMEHEESAEFVASLPVLLENWMGEILERAHYADLGHTSSADVLNQRQLELRELLSKATRVIAEIHSPELCLTAVHRQYLDEMFAIAGIERIEKELQSHFAVLDSHFQMLAAMAARKEQKDLEVQQFFFGAGAVLVGVPSLAAVLGLFDTGFSVNQTGDTIEAFVLIALIGLLFVAVFKLPGAKYVLDSVRRWLKAKFGALKKWMFGRRGKRKADP